MDKKKGSATTAALYEAVAAGDAAAVRRLLTAGAKPNVQDAKAALSPLTAAAEGGHAEVVRLLLAAGADPNYRRTALFPLAAAVVRGDADMVNALLAAGAAVDGRDEDGATALSYAAAAGDVALLQLLLGAGADPRRTDYSGRTALAAAVDNGRRAAVDLLLPLASPADRKRVEVAAEASVQGIDPERVSAFHKAAMTGDRSTVQDMLNAGLPVDVLGADGWTALMAAANRGKLGLVQLLVARGADVDRADECGETPLTYAAMYADRPTFEFLYPLASSKARKKAEKVVRRHQTLAKQYPQWKGWEPPPQKKTGS